MFFFSFAGKKDDKDKKGELVYESLFIIPVTVVPVPVFSRAKRARNGAFCHSHVWPLQLVGDALKQQHQNVCIPRLPVSAVHKFPPGLGWPRSPGSWGSLLVQPSSLGPQRQQQVLLTLVMVIRTKQIIGLKLCSCFLLLPAAAARPLIGSLLSWDQRAHTH